MHLTDIALSTKVAYVPVHTIPVELLVGFLVGAYETWVSLMVQIVAAEDSVLYEFVRHLRYDSLVEYTRHDLVQHTILECVLLMQLLAQSFLPLRGCCRAKRLNDSDAEGVPCLRLLYSLQGEG